MPRVLNDAIIHAYFTRAPNRWKFHQPRVKALIYQLLTLLTVAVLQMARRLFAHARLTMVDVLAALWNVGFFCLQYINTETRGKLDPGFDFDWRIPIRGLQSTPNYLSAMRKNNITSRLIEYIKYNRFADYVELVGGRPVICSNLCLRQLYVRAIYKAVAAMHDKRDSPSLFV